MLWIKSNSLNVDQIKRGIDRAKMIFRDRSTDPKLAYANFLKFVAGSINYDEDLVEIWCEAEWEAIRSADSDFDFDAEMVLEDNNVVQFRSKDHADDKKA